MSDNEGSSEGDKKHPDQLSDETVEKLYLAFEEGMTFDDIIEDDEIDVHSKTTVTKYKRRWEEEKELEEQMMQKELTPSKFKKALDSLPGVGNTKIDYAMGIIRDNTDILNNPNEIYNVLTQDVGVKKNKAIGFIRRRLGKYFSQGENSNDPMGRKPFLANQGGQTRSSSRSHNPFPNFPSSGDMGSPSQTQQQGMGGQGKSQRPPNRQGQPVQRQQPPRQPRSQPQQGASSNPPEGYITRKIPMKDEKGNIVRDKDGEPVKEEVQIPIDKAQEIDGGSRDQKGDESSDLEEIALEMVKQKMTEDDDDKQKTDRAMLKMVKEMQKSNQQTQQMIAQMRQEQEQPKEQGEEDEGGSVEDVKEYFDEKMREMKRQQEMEQKEERIDDLQGKLNALAEKHEEALDELKNKEYSKMPPEQQEKKWEKEMTELTANKTKDMVESLTEQGGKVNENIIDNLTTLFNEMKSQGELTRQEDAYKGLVMNLQEQEGWPLEKAKRKAEELLYGKRVDFDTQPQQQSRDRKERGGSSSSNKSELEQVVEESKRRAKSEG